MASESGDVARGEGARGGVEVVEPSQLQLAHARRVAESKATVPHIYLEAEVSPAGDPPGVEHVVRACALALREFPPVNGAYRDGRFELYSRINVGVAVSAQDTLLYPTIHDADGKSVTAIAGELERLSTRASEAAITQPELAGATFALADLRPLGISRSSGVVRGGQAAFLTVGQGGHGITLCLACDNRILHGPEAAGFLGRARDLLATPGDLSA